MANECYTCYHISGQDKNLVKKFYDDVKDAVSKHPKFKPVEGTENNWWGNIFLGAGYTKQQICHPKRGEFKFETRGYICFLNLAKDELSVRLEGTTAWRPNYDSVMKLVNEKYPGLSMLCEAEEDCEGLFINTDTSHKIFTAQYKVNVYNGSDEFTYYGTTKDELANFLIKYLSCRKEDAMKAIDKGDLDKIYERRFPTNASNGGCMNLYIAKNIASA